MTAPFTFSRIGYVYIPTTNIDASIAWYSDHLSFRLMNKFQDRGSFLAVMHHPHLHSIALLLIETNNNQSLEITRNGKPFPIMAMNCPNIEYTYQTLQEKGVELEKLQVLGAGEAKYFYFRDNEGNLLEAAWSIWDPKDEIKQDFVKQES